MKPPRCVWSYGLSVLLWASSGSLGSVWACTVCWGGSEIQGRAFAVSGYVLLGTPFLLLGGLLGGALLLQKRIHRQRQLQTTAEECPTPPAMSC